MRGTAVGGSSAAQRLEPSDPAELVLGGREQATFGEIVQALKVVVEPARSVKMIGLMGSGVGGSCNL
jgi:hypothetical protein